MHLHVEICIGPLCLKIGEPSAQAEEAEAERFPLGTDTLYSGYIDPAMTASPIPSMTYDE